MNSREEKRLEKTNVYNKMIKERRSRHIVWKHAFSIIQRFLRIPREYIYSIKKKWVRNHKERAHTTNLQTTRFNAYTRDVCERGSYKEWTNERDEARQTSQSNVYELTEMSIKINGVRNRSFSEYKERSVGSFFVKLMFIRCWKGIISSNNNNNVLEERQKKHAHRDSTAQRPLEQRFNFLSFSLYSQRFSNGRSNMNKSKQE